MPPLQSFEHPGDERERAGAHPVHVHTPHLRPGDRVAVVAPSGPVDAARLERGRRRLTALGLDVVVGRHTLGRHWRMSAPDADRIADLQEAWCDPQVRGVICARGGYGATRMLAGLDWTALGRAGPKVLHGSSDVTALHVAFGCRLRVSTSFGPMVAAALGSDRVPPDTSASLRAALFGDARLAVRGGRALVPGQAAGVLTGGTLSLLVSLLGTPWAPEPAAGRIVLLEDVGEAPYRVDRMLTQLVQAGWLEGVSGIVLGRWPACGDPEELQAVLADRLGSLGVPVLAGAPLGHGRPQLSVRLGVMAEMDADAGVLAQECSRRLSDRSIRERTGGDGPDPGHRGPARRTR